jgi:hypothetical protein
MVGSKFKTVSAKPCHSSPNHINGLSSPRKTRDDSTNRRQQENFLTMCDIDAPLLRAFSFICSCDVFSTDLTMESGH